MPRKHYRFCRLALGKPWCEAVELDDGRRFIIRPMQSSDAATLRRSFGRLSAEEIRMRFMHPLKELTPNYADRLASIDRQHEFALVLVENLHPDEALIGAVARAALDDDGKNAEFAIIVGAELTRHGLGRYLLGRLIEWARKKGLDSLYGLVLPDNRAMLALGHQLGFKIEHDRRDDDLVLIRRRLRSTR